MAETAIYYGEGFNKYKEIVDLCEEYGIIQRGGSWYSYNETKLGQGADNVAIMLQDNPELLEELETKLIEEFSKKDREENEENN